MSGKTLLDTNVVIALFDGDPAVVHVLETSTDVFICVPVLGELRYGALASTRIEENLARLDEFRRAVAVLACEADTAVFYSNVKLGLRKKGRPIPENDVWIAALARQHELTLVTRDSHFENVEALDLKLL